MPSFQTCKRLAVKLGYALEQKDEKPTDLQDLEWKPLQPVYDTSHEKPAPKIGNRLDFYKHWDPYGRRLDIDPRSYYDASNPSNPASFRSHGHPRNKCDPVVPQEPEKFVELVSPQAVANYADPIQKVMYGAVYPDGKKLPRTYEQITQEIKGIEQAQRLLEIVQLDRLSGGNALAIATQARVLNIPSEIPKEYKDLLENLWITQDALIVYRACFTNVSSENLNGNCQSLRSELLGMIVDECWSVEKGTIQRRFDELKAEAEGLKRIWAKRLADLKNERDALSATVNEDSDDEF
jgi:hypothetical protein